MIQGGARLGDHVVLCAFDAERLSQRRVTPIDRAAARGAQVVHYVEVALVWRLARHANVWDDFSR